MLPTFVIGLREGLEAALIVGIIAAFLRKQDRRDLLRWVFVGVGAAVVLCVAVGVALEVLSADLPQRQQEGLETVVGVLAVGMVTYMVVWMRRHSRELKGQLEGLAADALAGTSSAGRAMVLMAFLAVLREGFETVVFLLAVFNQSSSNLSVGIGAVLGILVAVALGYGIYRGGVHLNLSKFFRATGLVLVFVAAGLVVTALHTAHEAGWLNAGQGSTVDLTGLVQPGSVRSSLLTGMLGIQPYPVVVEVIGWLAYLVPVGLFVVWPPGRGPSRRTQRRGLAAAGVALAVAAVVCALVAPGGPAQRPVSALGGGVTAQALAHDSATAVVRTQLQSPAARAAAPGALTDVRLRSSGQGSRHGVAASVYRATVPGTGAAGRPAVLDLAQLARLDGGRVPIGLHVTDPDAQLRVTYRDVDVVSVWLEPRTGRVLDVRWTERVTASVDSSIGALPLSRPVAAGGFAASAPQTAAAATAARADLRNLDRREALHAAAWWCVAGAVLALALALALRERHRAPERTPAPEPAPQLLHG